MTKPTAGRVGGSIASEQQASADAVVDVRARVWELHLRGVPKSRIAQMVGVHRDTVGRYVRESYREVGADRKVKLAEKLSGAVARLRRVQEQAWDDHDADDERERSVLAYALDGAVGADGDEAQQKQQAQRANVRYQSQRSAYLRVVLDAEREIARLEGLYEGLIDDGGAVVFRIEQVGASVAADVQIPGSDAQRGIAGPGSAGEAAGGAVGESVAGGGS